MIDFKTLLSYYVRKYCYVVDSCDKKWGLNNMVSPQSKKWGPDSRGHSKFTPMSGWYSAGHFWHKFRLAGIFRGGFSVDKNLAANPAIGYGW